jgi:PrtD family type I secretion system ABC transporter
MDLWVFGLGFASAVAAVTIWDARRRPSENASAPRKKRAPAAAGAKGQPSELKQSLRSCARAFVGVALFSGVINVLMLTGSFFMLQIYDRVLPSRSVPTLVGMSVLVAVLYLAQAAVDLVRTRVLTRIGASLDESLSARVFAAIVALPLRTSTRGDGLQPVRDLDSVRIFLSGLGPTALFDLPWMPLYLSIIYAFHPVLGHAALAGAVVLVALTLLTEWLTKGPSRQASMIGAARNRLGEGSVRNAEVLTAMGLTGRMGERWREISRDYIARQQHVSDVGGGLGAISRVLRMMLQSGMLGLGAYLVIRQEATAGIIIAGSILTSRALAPVELAIAHWKGFLAARQGWARLEQLLKLVPANNEPMPLPAPRATLTIETVSIAAPGELRPIVQDVSLSLKAGQGLGVIGPSASGKSSLIRAIVGVWQPAQGKVRLDGAALDQWSGTALGRHIGYLPQDVELFAGTVAQNIARFDEDADPQSIVAAAEAAGVHELIAALKDGYETQIGEQGVALSAGQRQRIALARALHGNPFVVVLDEPSSNLDAQGEAALTRAIRGVRERGGIVVVVAHRPNALAALDMVLAMANGRAQAFGPKDEVLGKVLGIAAPMHGALKVVPEAGRSGT